MLVATAALIMFAVYRAASNEINDSYCKFTQNHTLCQFKGKTSEKCGNIVKQGIDDDEERSLILKLHNVLRSRIATGKETRGNPGPQPPAANMMELTWDSELELLAQTWTDQCISDHECPECRSVDRFKVGQNLYEFGHFSGSWERSAEGWYDEVVDFNNTFNDPFYVPRGLLIGHFTQLVWAQASKIGCGKIFFYPTPESRFGKQLFICDYGLAGNLIGSQMYQEGEPCSQCPLGTSCSLEYPGLCSGDPVEPLTVKPPRFELQWKIDALKSQTFSNNPNTSLESPLFVASSFDGIQELREEECVFECQKGGACSSSYQSTRPIFGDPKESERPLACKPCLEVCGGHEGQKLTIKINSTEPPKVEELLVSNKDSSFQGVSSNPASALGSRVQSQGSSDATCLYICQESGGCNVKIQSSTPVNGFTMGSCFSQDFGGSCSGTPERCQDCLAPCSGKEGQTFSEPAKELV